MKSNLLVITLLLASVQGSEDCPTKAELEQESGYPLIVPLNSTAVSVDWSNLWPSLDWTSSCVQAVSIIVNDDQPIEMDQMEITKTVVQVLPCVRLKIVVKLKLKQECMIFLFKIYLFYMEYFLKAKIISHNSMHTI